MLAAVLLVSVVEVRERVDRHKHCCPPEIAGVGTYGHGTYKRGNYGGGSGSAEYDAVGHWLFFMYCQNAGAVVSCGW